MSFHEFPLKIGDFQGPTLNLPGRVYPMFLHRIPIESRTTAQLAETIAPLGASG